MTKSTDFALCRNQGLVWNNQRHANSPTANTNATAMVFMDCRAAMVAMAKVLDAPTPGKECLLGTRVVRASVGGKISRLNLDG